MLILTASLSAAFVVCLALRGSEAYRLTLYPLISPPLVSPPLVSPPLIEEEIHLAAAHPSPSKNQTFKLTLHVIKYDKFIQVPVILVCHLKSTMVIDLYYHVATNKIRYTEITERF